ncbi:ankyrin repeat and SOCS box protein 9 isoform X3 [Rhinatrema bivittatum]|uniref:ankyrin repeat and SOCS box protein 9 isoform X3 n=1 Tax=Rhinatrema bivittatum TaxID=194408 RepID=UPI001127D03B|nr:ankyrin repeat and SOCS box protein 9 isoform X3 [Rhinatrema bivittatum]
MDAEGASGKAGGSHGMRGQPSTAYVSNPLMSDFVSDWSPMHDAAIHGQLLALNNLINQVDGASLDWHTPLFNACISGNAACVNLLVQNGASPHPVCDLASPIHEAAKRGHTECVESLVSHGANFQRSIQHLGTPLYLACKSQQVECAKKLLQLGANANDGKYLDSNLHAAAENCNADLVKLLIDFGADTKTRNADGKRPAELVPPHSTLAQVFLNREGPLSLMQLCRLYIRKCVGHKYHHRMTELPLPEELKCFLLYRQIGFINDD